MALLDWSWITTGTSESELQKTGDELDSKLAALNQKALDEGRYTQAQFDTAEKNRETGLTGNVAEQVNAEFDAGWKEGQQNVVKAVGSVASVGNDIINTGVKAAFTGIFKLIPWYLWIAAALALFIYFGGWRLLFKLKQ